MDAVKFIEEYKRLCDSFANCANCPLLYQDCDKFKTIDLEKAVPLVEEWSATHPRKTRQDVFLKQWPNAEFDCQGVIAIDPCDVDKTMHGKDEDCYNGNCDDCRREFWMQEVE